MKCECLPTCLWPIIHDTRAPPPAPGDPSAPAQTNADVVSFVLAYLLSALPFVHLPADKVAVLSRQISLALVGAIILSSIRRVLRGVAGVRRFLFTPPRL